MVRYVNTQPDGHNMNRLLRDREDRFGSFEQMKYYRNPSEAFRVIGHVEAGGFSRPGDGAVALALARGPYPPGSPEANQIAYSAKGSSGNQGSMWDYDENDTETVYDRIIASSSLPPSARQPSGVNLDPESLKGYDWFNELPEMERNEITSRWEQEYSAETEKMSQEMVERGELGMLGSGWEGVQMLSRGGMLGLDTIRNTADQLTMKAELDRMGLDPGVQSAEGQPIAQYGRAMKQGQRVEMGQGFFAEGEFTEDVQSQIDAYDAQTDALTDTDFARMQREQGGQVTIQGRMGVTYTARNLEELKSLRDGAGRAAVAYASAQSSPAQAARGIPYGKLHEDFMRRGGVMAQDKNGDYYHVGLGQSTVALMGITQDDWSGGLIWDQVSTAIDFAKNIAEAAPAALGLIGKGVDVVGGLFRGGEEVATAARATETASKAGRTILGAGANRNVGITGEASRVGRANGTWQNVIDHADFGARERAVDDLMAGGVHREAAINSAARSLDQDLGRATRTINTVADHAVKRSEEAHQREVRELVRTTEGLTPKQAAEQAKSPITRSEAMARIEQAQGGHYAMSKWMYDTMVDQQGNAIPATEEFSNWRNVSDRDGVDLVNGVFGKAEGVDDDLLTQITADVDDLNELVSSGRMYPTLDEETGDLVLTMDADLGRAASTLESLTVERAAAKGSRVAWARKLIAARDDVELHRLEVEQAEASREALAAEIRARDQKITDIGVRQLDDLPPTYPGGERYFHGTNRPETMEELQPLHLSPGGKSQNIVGPGVYSTTDPPMGGTYVHDPHKGKLTHLLWNGPEPPRILDADQHLTPESLRSVADSVRGTYNDYRISRRRSGLADPIKAGGKRRTSAGEVALDDIWRLLNEAADDMDNGIMDVSELESLFDDLSIGNIYSESVREHGAAVLDAADGPLMGDLLFGLNMRFGGPMDDADEIALLLNQRLGANYDAIQHTGGLFAGGGEKLHNVHVWLHPENMKATHVRPAAQHAATGGRMTYVSPRKKAIIEADIRMGGAKSLAWDAEDRLKVALKEAREDGTIGDLLGEDPTWHGLGRAGVSDWEGVERLARTTDAQMDAAEKHLVKMAFQDHWAMRQNGQKVLQGRPQGQRIIDQAKLKTKAAMEHASDFASRRSEIFHEVLHDPALLREYAAQMLGQRGLLQITDSLDIKHFDDLARVLANPDSSDTAVRTALNSVTIDWPELADEIIYRDMVDPLFYQRRTEAVGAFEEASEATVEGMGLLGDAGQAVDEYDNLVRVLRRADVQGDLTRGARGVKPRLSPDAWESMFTGSSGKMTDLFRQLAETRSTREVHQLLKPTFDAYGSAGISRQLVGALKNANTPEEVAAAFAAFNNGTQLIAPKITMLGKWASAANASGWTGTTLGALGGGYEEYEEGGNIADILAGGIAGGLLGSMASSAAIGVGAGLASTVSRSTSRKVQDVADLMDLMLAGTRHQTAGGIQGLANLRQARGVNPNLGMGRGMAGLTVPQQFSTAMGHLPWGRRVARQAPRKLDLNDPDQAYHAAWEFARSIGLSGEERVTELIRDVTTVSDAGRKVTTKEVRSVVSTAFDPKGTGFVDEVESLRQSGWRVKGQYDMEDVWNTFHEMQSNNPASGLVAIRSLGEIVDATLVRQGMDAEYASVMGDLMRSYEQAFIGNIDAVGNPANHAQALINAKSTNLEDQALMIAEHWTGTVHLPEPQKVYRAMDQLHFAGQVRQAFSGAGIWNPWQANRALPGGTEDLRRGAFWEELGKVFTPEESASFKAAFTPTLERNVANRAARLAMGTVMVPLVLLGRTFSFLTRVLGEDQARMIAADLDGLVNHPINAVSAILANYKFWQKQGFYRGVPARSLIPDEYIDPRTGKHVPDVLDDMSNYDLSETVKGSLRVYHPDNRSGRRIFGHTHWDTIRGPTDTRPKGDPGYMEAVATEYRQLLSDPMASALARANFDGDPVEEVFTWLNNSVRGREVMAQFGKQFTAEEFQEFLDNDGLRAFLADQYARLHLKTGGDYVFQYPDGTIVFAGGAAPISKTSQQAIDLGLDQLSDGYHVTRAGDDELIDAVRKGKYGPDKDWDAAGSMDETQWKWVQEWISKSNDRFAKGRAQGVSEHRFPEQVKGIRKGTEVETVALEQKMTEALDFIYDFVLGQRAQVFSRQPVLGNYYWERVGMLLPSMDPKMRNAFKALALKTGAHTGKKLWGRVEEIGAQFGDIKTAGTMDDFQTLHKNSQAYAVERLNNTLFDLNRQRNFIDAFRLVFPFMGPMVEAMENWTRIIRRNPNRVWRKGMQLHRMAYQEDANIDQDPNGDRSGEFWLERMRNSTFWTDPDSGQDMVRVPGGRVASTIFARGGDMLGMVTPEDADRLAGTPIDARLTGFNTVFHAGDIGPEQPKFAGLPLGVMDPGASMFMKMPAHWIFGDAKSGWQKEVDDYLFPSGPPADFVDALLPYNLRVLRQGLTADYGDQEFQGVVADEWTTMVATGEVGQGLDYEYNLDQPGVLEDALETAKSRARGRQIWEGIIRGVMPTMVTPEALLEVEALGANGVEVNRVVKISALAEEAEKLMQAQSAVEFPTQDGYMVSTEGDPEAALDFLNRKYNTNIFDLKFLDLPTTDTIYPSHYSKAGLEHVNANPGLYDTFHASAHLIRPGYEVLEHGSEEFDWDAFNAAVEREDVDRLTLSDTRRALDAQLLSAEYDGIEKKADDLYGTDADLEGEEYQELREKKKLYEADEKARAGSAYEEGTIDSGTKAKVFEDLRRWTEYDWEGANLSPEEMATVNAVNWYFDTIWRWGEEQAAYVGQTQVTNIGGSTDERLWMHNVRQDMINQVDSQLAYASETGHDMGNFIYIYNSYIAPQFEDLKEPDPAEYLERIAKGDFGLIPGTDYKGDSYREGLGG